MRQKTSDKFKKKDQNESCLLDSVSLTRQNSMTHCKIFFANKEKFT